MGHGTTADGERWWWTVETPTGDAARPGLFTPAQRCDRCTAQARFLVLLPSGGELAFCGHHARRYRPGLGDAAWLEDPAELPAVPT